MDERETKLNYEWLTPERLIHFIDELRQAGYNIGTSQYIAAQDLIIALIAKGTSFDMPQRLGNLLGPLFCSSPSEQEDFQNRFSNWLNRMGVEAIKTDSTQTSNIEQTEAELEKIEKHEFWHKAGLKTGLIITATALLILATFLLLKNSKAVPINDIETVWSVIEYLFGFGVLLSLISLIAWRIWIFYKAHQFLVRRQASEQPQMKRLYIKKYYETMWGDMFFFRTAAEFRRRIEVLSENLDIEKTVEMTVRQGGWFTPVYGRCQVVPEYLVLIDRISYEDHQAIFFEEMADKLKRHEVFIKTYYFDKDPRICFSDDIKFQSLSIYEIAAKYDDHRVIIFSDGSSFFNSHTGLIESWIEVFSHFSIVSLLTPEPPSHWGYREDELREHFALFPSTHSGLIGFVRSLHKNEYSYDTDNRAAEPFPEILRTRAMLWTERTERRVPEEELTQEMVASLFNYLGEAGLYWLSACAVYPEVRWHLTKFFGNALKMENGMKLTDVFSIVDFIRVPWLRYGYMPDWLRIMLINELSDEKEKHIRSLLEADLVASQDLDKEVSFYLEIATRHKNAFSTFASAIRQTLLRRGPKDNPLKDYVFISFMAGEKSKLAVRLPSFNFKRSRSKTPYLKEYRDSVLLQEINRINNEYSSPIIVQRRKIDGQENYLAIGGYGEIYRGRDSVMLLDKLTEKLESEREKKVYISVKNFPNELSIQTFSLALKKELSNKNIKTKMEVISENVDNTILEILFLPGTKMIETTSPEKQKGMFRAIIRFTGKIGKEIINVTVYVFAKTANIVNDVINMIEQRLRDKPLSLIDSVNKVRKELLKEYNLSEDDLQIKIEGESRGLHHKRGIITEKVIKPHQCVLAFGIPTTKEDFYNDLKSLKKDFAKKDNIFPVYMEQIIDPLNKVEPTLKRLGVRVVNKLTLSDFANLFLYNRFDVIILFSHWKDDAAEFYDGLVTTSKIVEQVPFDFSGIIDLCISNPEPLRIALDFDRPNCSLKFSTVEISVSFWLQFYKNLFIYLEQDDINYFDAVDNTLKMFKHPELRGIDYV